MHCERTLNNLPHLVDRGKFKNNRRIEFLMACRGALF